MQTSSTNSNHTTISDKKQTIIETAPGMSINDKSQILNIIEQHSIDTIQTHPDGSRIDLDRVSDSTIEHIYNYIKQNY